MTKQIASLAALGVAGLLAAQTPPVKPQTPDIKIPPPVVVPPPPGSAGVQPLSSEEAVAIALSRHFSLTVARANIEAAAGRSDQARSALRPQIGASAGFNDQVQLRGNQQGTPNRFTVGVSVDQLLFDFGRTRNQVRQQSALEEAQRQALTTTEQEVALQTRVAFHTFAESIRLLTAAEQNVTNRQRQLSQADARVGSGLGAPSDLVRAKTSLADAVQSLEAARQAVETSRTALAERLGIDPRTPINPVTSDEAAASTEALEVNRLVEQALQNRTEVREAQLRLQAAGLGVAIAKLTNAPRVSLTGDLNTRGANDPFNSSTASVGLNITWTFGDGGLAKGRTREAIAQEEIARANLTDLSQSIVSEVANAFVELRTAEQRVETATAQVANAAELVRISEGRYQGEIGTFIEVTDAQASLFNAERNLAQARADLFRAQARLNRAIGAR